ncbi:hypothetical protein MRB53_010057 [Persea americana]|uniref:Uncharacterized protein n=1 Tax=Persea americana TaxID=3435 RepID=A0ACC2LQR2_PERAE|nr:hypothetical protein MRB53_010057 [Persea americana]
MRTVLRWRFQTPYYRSLGVVLGRGFLLFSLLQVILVFRGNSPATLRRLSVVVSVLRSFFNVAEQSPLSELAKDLAYYEGIVASPLQIVRSSGESLSLIGSNVAVAVGTPQLESASWDLDQKRSNLTKVIKSERGLVAQLECFRSCRKSLEKETVDLDVVIKDQWCSLELDL